MHTYLVQYLFESGHVQKQAHIRARNPRMAFEQFRKANNLPEEFATGYKSGKESTTFKTPYTWYVVINVTPSPKMLADALYQLTKTYTDGTCYETSNPYSKPHVQNALKVLALYAGTGDYLDALEKMEAIGHVYRYKQS